MSWEPHLINSGLFDNTPESNMTVPFDNARQIGTLYTVGAALYCNYSASQTFEPNKWSASAWNTKRGKSFDGKLADFWEAHHGDGTHSDEILAAVTVKNPTGAQFYKQELVVYGSIVSGNIIHVDVGSPEDHHELDYYQAEVSITRLARREYATPTAVPTVTDLNVGTVGVTPNVRVSGEIACEGLFYFLSEGLFCAGEVHYSNKYYYGFGFYTEGRRDYNWTGGQDRSRAFSGVALEIDYLEQAFGGSFEPEETDDPNEDPDEPGGGESGEGGGDGDHDDSEDNIPIPPLPPVGAADAGFVHMFHMTIAEIQNFAHDMFNATIWQAIKDFFADPMDFIAGVMLLPFAPTGTSMRKPKFGNNVWANAFALVDSQFAEIDMGYMTVKKYYDSFLDFDNFTKVKIFLPYIGYKDLLADEVIGNTLHCVYHVDVATGDCVAFLEINDGTYTQVCYQFQGNCGVRVPYGRLSFDAAVSSSLQLMGGAATLAIGGATLATGGLAGATAGIAVAQIAGQVGTMTADAVAGQKRNFERSVSLGASAGYMGVQYPYIIREIPNQSRPGNYRALHGYPSNLGGTLSQFSGYTCVETIELEGIQCTEPEKEEIIELLRGGVII